MKKFITYVSMQPENNLCKVKYEPIDMEISESIPEVYFPISVLIYFYTVKDEEIELVCMIDSGNEDEIRNFKRLQTELEEASKKIGFKYTIRKVEIMPEESIECQLDLFENLINCVDNGDKVYACATYGTKPIPMVEMLALNYAYRVKDNVAVEKIVYGKVNRKNGEIIGANIYDITALFAMNQIVNHLAENKVKNPEKAIRMLLGREG